jgi:hypothetical protein
MRRERRLTQGPDCGTVFRNSSTRFTNSAARPTPPVRGPIDMMRKALLLVSALLVVACTSVSIPAPELPQRVATAANIQTDSIVHAQAVRFALSAERVRYVPFTLGVYAQTQSHVYLLAFDAAAKSLVLRATLPLNELRSATVATRGAFSHLQQLQLEGNGQTAAINFTNSSDAEAGSKERTQVAVGHLQKVGQQIGATAHWFIPRELAGFSVPIPAAK